jgi:hypothetical protein
MVWGKKNADAAAPPPIPDRRSPDQLISEMLTAYQQHFYEGAQKAPDASVEAAKEKVARANKLISESRIGYSACTLLDHVRHWDAWSKRDDFQKWVSFPAIEVTGTRDKVENNHDRTTIDFRYQRVPYSVIFIEKGVSAWNSDDFNSYATLEIVASYHTVLGLDISTDISKEFDRWHFNNVFAFAPGEWMKQIVEMAAYIDANQSQQFSSYADEDALRRASRIKL